MQILEEMDIGKIRNKNDSEEEIQKIENVVFCKNCGTQYNENEIIEKLCTICDGDSFLNGEFASVLAGYIEMNKHGTLKNYYQKRFGKSAVRMNNKRIIFWLLIRDKLVEYNNHEMEQTLERIMWKRN